MSFQRGVAVYDARALRGSRRVFLSSLIDDVEVDELEALVAEGLASPAEDAAPEAEAAPEPEADPEGAAVPVVEAEAEVGAGEELSSPSETRWETVTVAVLGACGGKKRAQPVSGAMLSAMTSRRVLRDIVHFRG